MSDIIDVGTAETFTILKVLQITIKDYVMTDDLKKFTKEM